jgi:hypothetical protein
MNAEDAEEIRPEIYTDNTDQIKTYCFLLICLIRDYLWPFS